MGQASSPLEAALQKHKRHNQRHKQSQNYQSGGHGRPAARTPAAFRVFWKLASNEIVVVKIIIAVICTQIVEVAFHRIPTVFFRCSALAASRRVGGKAGSAKRAFVVVIKYGHCATSISGRDKKRCSRLGKFRRSHRSKIRRNLTPTQAILRCDRQNRLQNCFKSPFASSGFSPATEL